MGISYGIQVEKHNYSPFEPSLGQHFTLWILKSSAAPTLEEVSLQRPKMKDMETRLCGDGNQVCEQKAGVNHKSPRASTFWATGAMLLGGV